MSFYVALLLGAGSLRIVASIPRNCTPLTLQVEESEAVPHITDEEGHRSQVDLQFRGGLGVRAAAGDGGARVGERHFEGVGVGGARWDANANAATEPLERSLVVCAAIRASEGFWI